VPRLIQLGGELVPSQPEARAQRQDRESLFLPRGCCLPSTFSQCEGRFGIRGVYWSGTTEWNH